MAILIENGCVYIDKDNIIANGYVGITDGKIDFISSDRSDADNFIVKYGNGLERIDASNKVIISGLVNSHTHTPMVILRNYGSDRTLQDWLFNKIIPKEQLLSEDDVYWGSLAAQAEMIKSGTTAFADMYFYMDSIAKAVADSGMRANLCVPVLTNDWSSGKKVTKEIISQAKEYLRNWNNSNSGRIKTYVELHSTYLYDAAKLYNNIETAKEMNTGIHMHLHETIKEVTESVSEFGKEPIEMLEELGAFNVPVVAAHCVHMSETAMGIITKYNVNVAHNPTSNMKLASGFCPVPEFLRRGINVALGTDGCASNNNLNMFEEMHITALIHKGYTLNPTVLKAYEVITMATENGAKAIGFGDICGKLEVGRAADIIIVKLSGTHLTPLNDLESAIVYSMQGQDVDTVIVNGKILMKKRQFRYLDEELIMAKVRSIAKRIFNT
ncbi:MAG: amidohydrolase [Clostridiales bacterium]|jgi:5-methylthioadenosine/S-adenosylhomocysteine deaminase|nr:amidohydrolase [Clostridiales bacterium]